MPELRQEPITARWVVIATDRAKRPDHFSQADKKETATDAECPFCYGNEQMTPPEVMAYRPPETQPNTPGWKVRIVPNKFPAFVQEPNTSNTQSNLYKTTAAAGFHEVVINSPNHDKDLALLSNKELVTLISAYKDRYQQLKKDPRTEYILIIVNHGEKAGASIEHPHAQLFAAPMIPAKIDEELTGSLAYYKNNDRCIFCDIIREEMGTKLRVILDTKHFIVFCPYASRLPFETWIVPKKHSSHFEKISPQEINNLASVLRLIFMKLRRGLNDPAYNFFIHTGPCHSAPLAHYHWHLEILPKLNIQAGFEIGSGIMINITRPEDTAAFLKSIDI
jgi:UDPglucose--hexose-1-phosphate uridylyltransferase